MSFIIGLLVVLSLMILLPVLLLLLINIVLDECFDIELSEVIGPKVRKLLKLEE